MSARVLTHTADVGLFSKEHPPASFVAAMPTSPFVPGLPVPVSSRTGRSRQRYGKNGERLVAGCIPVRFVNGIEHPDAVEVMLISSRGGKGWAFPKGGWEDDETVQAAAMRETVEEAGVRGHLEEPVIGTFAFNSAKHVQGKCNAFMFVLHVAEELDMWPEYAERQRCWVSLSEATLLCRHPWMREALHMWMRRRGWEACTPAQQLAAQADEAFLDSNSDSLSA